MFLLDSLLITFNNLISTVALQRYSSTVVGWEYTGILTNS